MVVLSGIFPTSLPLAVIGPPSNKLDNDALMNGNEEQKGEAVDEWNRVEINALYR